MKRLRTQRCFNFGNICAGAHLGRGCLLLILFISGLKAQNSPRFHELIITELMVDPEGPHAPLEPISEYEYLEIFNASGTSLNLEGCILSDESKSLNLPFILLSPQEYLILCAPEAEAILQTFGKTQALEGFPNLRNSGEFLELLNAQHGLIYRLAYDKTWYQSSLKAEGAWSLEMMDVQNPCVGASNWRASQARRGGSPGKLNSWQENRPDLRAPELWRVEAIEENKLRLHFSEAMDSLSLIKGQYHFKEAIQVSGIRPQPPFFKVVELDIYPELLLGARYHLSVGEVQDCSHNRLSLSKEFSLGRAELADSGDLLINEILFNPYSGGVDFVEIINRSDKFIQLHGWEIATEREGIIAFQEALSEEAYILAPKELLYLSEDWSKLEEFYPQVSRAAYLEIANLPPFPDEEGTCILISPSRKVWERLDYQEDFHFEGLDEIEGVSLERLSYDLATQDKNSWQSAASSVGFASPGQPNSQKFIPEVGSLDIRLEPKVFSPDGDGQADQMQLYIQNTGGNGRLKIEIYNRRGQLVRELGSSIWLGSSPQLITWDGYDAQGNVLDIGPYLVLIRLKEGDGQEKKYREKVVIGKRF